MADFIYLDAERAANIRTPNHGMWLQPMTRRITLYFENLTIADTSDALCVIEMKDDLHELVLYLPRKDVLAELKRNDRSVRCPLKGTSSFFDLLGPDRTVIVPNAAWSHPDPKNGAGDLKNRVAFSKAHFSFEDLPL